MTISSFKFLFCLCFSTLFTDKQCMLIYVNFTELELLIHKGVDLPQGAVTLSSNQSQLGIQLETAAGDLSSYPGNDHA